MKTAIGKSKEAPWKRPGFGVMLGRMSAMLDDDRIGAPPLVVISVKVGPRREAFSFLARSSLGSNVLPFSILINPTGILRRLFTASWPFNHCNRASTPLCRLSIQSVRNRFYSEQKTCRITGSGTSAEDGFRQAVVSSDLSLIEATLPFPWTFPGPLLPADTRGGLVGELRDRVGWSPGGIAVVSQMYGQEIKQLGGQR